MVIAYTIWLAKILSKYIFVYINWVYGKMTHLMGKKKTLFTSSSLKLFYF